jgi:CRISPR system Cascade subunit CasB
MTASTPSGPTLSTAQALRAAVASTVAGLQAAHLARVPSAGAALARLRRAATAAPGSDPDVWAYTVQPLADNPRATALLGRSDTPSAHERAAHVAVTLYAVHQQGRPQAMHRTEGGSVGQAVGALQRADRRAGGDGTAILRRFSALATASSWAETVHHLRSLVTQLRAEGVPLDYGRLADDLARLADPRRSKEVRLAWGRDLYRRLEVEVADGAGETTDAEPAEATPAVQGAPPDQPTT